MKAKYDLDTLRPQIFQVMDVLVGGKIVAGSRVVIKPNLLAPAAPERAMLTHPAVVRCVVEYVLQRGVKPQISDSPAIGSFSRVLKESGIKSALEGLDVEYKEFQKSVAIDAREPFKRLEIAEDAVTADLLINLPKLKTHSQMLLTLGVKNLFGCVVGLRKPEWHLRAGVDREKFALLLVHIYSALRPAVTILDGITAMEGQGPGKSGTPRDLGILMASEDALAVDAAACSMLGIDPDQLLTNKVARQMGLFDGRVVVQGEMVKVEDFRLPEMAAVVFGPQYFHDFLRRHLIQRPVPSDPLCRSCGECWEYCPAGAISQEGKKVVFDYGKCIRCYCCLEVCPHGAISADEPLAGRALRKLGELKESLRSRRCRK